jgi:hypothetical protein
MPIFYWVFRTCHLTWGPKIIIMEMGAQGYVCDVWGDSLQEKEMVA